MADERTEGRTIELDPTVTLMEQQSYDAHKEQYLWNRVRVLATEKFRVEQQAGLLVGQVKTVTEDRDRLAQQVANLETPLPARTKE